MIQKMKIQKKMMDFVKRRTKNKRKGLTTSTPYSIIKTVKEKHHRKGNKKWKN